MNQNDREFLHNVILERMSNHYASNHSKEDSDFKEFCALEDRLNKVLAGLPKEQEQVVQQYLQSIFDRDGEHEEFYYRCGLMDGYKICRYIHTVIDTG